MKGYIVVFVTVIIMDLVMVHIGYHRGYIDSKIDEMHVIDINSGPLVSGDPRNHCYREISLNSVLQKNGVYKNTYLHEDGTTDVGYGDYIEEGDTINACQYK